MSDAEQRQAERLAALAEHLRVTVKPHGALALERGLNALRARLGVERKRPRLALRRALALAVAVSSVALGALLVRAWWPHPRSLLKPVALTRVVGGQILEGGYLSEVGHRGVELDFDEGSTFVLTPGTRGRLRALSADGARFEVDHGTAAFRITPSPERRWIVEAGPFLVSVKGTDFTVVWDPTAERLDVELRRGRVTVSGPVVGDDLGLRPGQHLAVSLPRAETTITEARLGSAPAAAADSGDAAAPTVAVTPSAREAPSSLSVPSSAARPPAAERGWRQALAKGQWDRILADVERAGVTASLQTLSSDDLFVLADAARYRRRPDLARAALLTERERFPNSPRSLDAVFLLGRVEELRPNGSAQAIARYDEYLAHAPSGTYAAEALGRKMILVKATAGPERAREIASEYLRRFPNGSYAEAARTLQRVP
ncbi:MAG TPA: FecR domain-containing protein [Polyangiaceae bacterium]|nr:FecR domain-containing protein [Polyangiaceae bacterium]